MNIYLLQVYYKIVRFTVYNIKIVNPDPLKSFK
jgi:hypothetical protein